MIGGQVASNVALLGAGSIRRATALCYRRRSGLPFPPLARSCVCFLLALGALLTAPSSLTCQSYVCFLLALGALLTARPAVPLRPSDRLDVSSPKPSESERVGARGWSTSLLLSSPTALCSAVATLCMTTSRRTAQGGEKEGGEVRRETRKIEGLERKTGGHGENGCTLYLCPLSFTQFRVSCHLPKPGLLLRKQVTTHQS